MPFACWTRVVALLFALPLVATLLPTGQSAAAAPRLQLHPVELVGYKGDDLRLKVELPCGSSYYGLIARVAGSRKVAQNTLEVAAVVSQDSIVCTSMPVPVEVVVDFLATTGFDVISPMAIDLQRARVQIAKIQDLRIEAGDGKRTKLTAVYEPRCGETIGTLIRQPDAARLELAIAERPSRTLGMSTGSCTARPRSRTISTLAVKPKIRVQALRDKPSSLSRAFELRLAPIESGSVRSDAGGVALRYKRACNEAPVGLVLGTPRQVVVKGRTQTQTQTQIGMLVARYYNYPCSGAPAASVSAFRDAGLSLPAKSAVVLMTPTSDAATAALTLSMPLTISRPKTDELKLAHLGVCRGEAFGVYARDASGTLAVGILTRAGAAVSATCGQASGQASIDQPFLSKSVGKGQISAMRLKGA